MRFTVPGKAIRERVRSLLLAYFDEGDEADLDQALQLIADYYGVKPPRVVWRVKPIDRGWTAARTHADNRFELMRPASWHLQHVVPPTPENWCDTIFHEFWHLLTWVDEEKKADAFARRWMEE